jgi:hypothetical protein
LLDARAFDRTLQYGRHAMLLQAAEPLIIWSDPFKELFGFVALFLSAGAVGFRYAALRGWRAPELQGAPELFGHAARRGALLGLAGALGRAVVLWTNLPGAAARAHVPVSQLLSGDLPTMIGVGLAVLAIAGFALAASGRAVGWPLSAVGVVLGALPDLFTGKWARLVNPAHALAAGLWIGTLFVMMVAGIALVLRDQRVRDTRGRLVAEMVHAFSPLAMTMGGIVVIFGLVTAWQHLNPLTSLFTTPYGWALLAKLVAVAAVYGLGAWNWRQRPTLGSHEAAHSIYRSARRELVAAGVVLVITAILISLPSPRPPKAPGQTAPPGAPAAMGSAN